MSRFRVALSGDFRKADGSPTYPSFDLVAADRRTRTSRSVYVDAGRTASCRRPASPAAMR